MRYDEALIDYGSAADRPRNLVAVFVPSEQPVFAIPFSSSLLSDFFAAGRISMAVRGRDHGIRVITLKFIGFC